MEVEKLYIYVAHHQSAEMTADAFVESFGQTAMPSKGGKTDPPRGNYSNKGLKQALSQDKLYSFSGKFKGRIRANSIERFGVAIFIYKPASEQDKHQFTTVGTGFINRLAPVFAHISFKSKTHTSLHGLGSADFETVARVGLNGIGVRTWLGESISKQIMSILPDLGVVQRYPSGVQIDLLPDPFVQNEEDLIAANKKCRQQLADIGMLCDDSKMIDELWKKAPQWQPFDSVARPDTYLVEHTIKGGIQSLPKYKNHVNSIDAIFDVMYDKNDPRRKMIQYEMQYLLQSEDVELRAAACVFYRHNYGINYHRLVTLVRHKMHFYDGVQNPWSNEQDLRALLATSLAINYNRGNLKLTQHVKAEVFRAGFGGRVIAGLINHDPEFVVANALKIEEKSPGTMRTMFEIFTDLGYPVNQLVEQLKNEHPQEVRRILNTLN